MPAIVEKGKGALTHKIGPLPLWGWVVAGAVLVFVFRRARGGSSGGGSNGIAIPSLVPGSSADLGGGSPAFGSPNLNAQGGSDPAPGGAAPWWVSKPAWWDAMPTVSLSGPSTNGSAGHGDPTGSTPNVFRTALSPATVTPRSPRRSLSGSRN